MVKIYRYTCSLFLILASSSMHSMEKNAREKLPPKKRWQQEEAKQTLSIFDDMNNTNHPFHHSQLRLDFKAIATHPAFYQKYLEMNHASLRLLKVAVLLNRINHDLMTEKRTINSLTENGDTIAYSVVKAHNMINDEELFSQQDLETFLDVLKKTYPEVMYDIANSNGTSVNRAALHVPVKFVSRLKKLERTTNKPKKNIKKV